jgi:hypothetical protein
LRLKKSIGDQPARVRIITSGLNSNMALPGRNPA